MTSDRLIVSRDVGRMEYMKSRRVAHLSAFEILVHFKGFGREDILDPLRVLSSNCFRAVLDWLTWLLHSVALATTSIRSVDPLDPVENTR